MDVTITLRAASTPTVRDPLPGSAGRRSARGATLPPAGPPFACRCATRRTSSTSAMGSPTRSRSAATSPAAPSCRSARSWRGTSRRAPPTIACSSGTSCWRGWSSTSARPTTDPGFDVVTENRFFADRAGVEWEELSFSVNGTKWEPDRPAFPLLQAEKVLSPPLDLRLDADYRYRLDGTETVDGAPCYVVRFTPNAASTAKSLYRGTVWIDRDTFRRRKLQAVQTGLDAPVVSNDETVRFARVGETGGRRVLLLDRNGHPPDRAHRRPQHPGREGDPLQRVPARSGGLRGAARRGAAQRSRDVPRHRQGDAVLREGGRYARRQRQGHDQRQGDGHRHDDRSVVRLSAADPRHQLPRLRVRQPGLAARPAVRWRPRARQHPAAEADRADRRQRGFLRHRGAGQRHRLRCHRAARRGESPDVAALGRRQSRLAVHRLPEGAGELSAGVQRLPEGPDDRRGLRRAAQHHHARPRPRLANIAAAAIRSSPTAPGTADRRGRRGGRPAR